MTPRGKGWHRKIGVARHRLTNGEWQEIELLSPREAEVLELVALGLANTEIAHRLGIAEPSVRTHVSNILAKVHAKNRTHAVRLALELGLLRLDSVTQPKAPPTMTAARALTIAQLYLRWAQELMKQEQQP